MSSKKYSESSSIYRLTEEAIYDDKWGKEVIILNKI